MDPSSATVDSFKARATLLYNNWCRKLFFLLFEKGDTYSPPRSGKKRLSSRYSWHRAHGDRKQCVAKSEHGVSTKLYFSRMRVRYLDESVALAQHSCRTRKAQQLAWLPPSLFSHMH